MVLRRSNVTLCARTWYRRVLFGLQCNVVYNDVMMMAVVIVVIIKNDRQHWKSVLLFFWLLFSVDL